MERKRPENYNENYERSFVSQPASPPAGRGRGDTYWVGANGGMPIQIPPRRLSFKEAITKAEDQIGFHEYSRQHHCYGILHDMCRAMAEVYMMSPTTKIKVNGEELEAGMVAEVLEQVNQGMAEDRANELLETIAGVTNIKAYLRSALYNKVFEFEAADVKLQEQIKRDMPWLFKP